jgi:septum formation protein
MPKKSLSNHAVIDRIILASQSPRRVQLMQQAGFQFTVKVPEIIELQNPNETPQQMVCRLSLAKARKIAQELVMHETLEKKTTAVNTTDSTIIIAADTTVVHPGGKKTLGKPSNKNESKKMIEIIAGKTHVVLTGFAVIKIQAGKMRTTTKVVSTKVKIRKLTAKEIIDYVNTGEGMDKAGSYAAQGIGMGLIESIHGSYTNVVGLPMAELIAVLRNMK